MSTSPLSPTERTTVRRMRERARSERSALYEVLDSGMVCHLGIVIDGTPRVIPTGYGRVDDTLYVHGSTGSAGLRTAPSQEICVTVTLVDGIVLGRSVVHHSMNYRSAMIYGVPRLLTDPEEKLAGLRAITEHIAPGQWTTARLPTRKELASVAVLALSLEEASVKTRTGGPKDEEEDYALDVWAGVLPVRQTFGEPVPDDRLRPGIPVPPHIADRAHAS
ncbi:hypothetical protein Arub01_36620 [Actinomadura rubrobrunea]|uniref:Pyridoxamine 5'-phosphate oxidase family protein n=1 Tax=Actinomadura rubrobrunea TaxID=115335 RepID=A0A9W6UWU5_9ACTN|nr:pyridoxamine 5'-phosphate oxidase family protein [Actinomadura rubrobrunea]GLW65418.1 hypothetical protein Arub01_36620 [Actinomadura rubrobrunea]